MSIEWTTRQISGIQRLVEPPRFNPRPAGQIRPGSASEAVLAYLQRHEGRSFYRRALIVATGRTRKSVDWALLFLVALQLVEQLPAATPNEPRSGTLRYRATRKAG